MAGVSPLETLSRCLFSAMHEAFDQELCDAATSRASRAAIRRMERAVQAGLGRVVRRIGPRCASLARAREVLARHYRRPLVEVTDAAAFLALRAARSEPPRRVRTNRFPPSLI